MRSIQVPCRFEAGCDVTAGGWCDSSLIEVAVELTGDYLAADPCCWIGDGLADQADA